MQKGILFFLPVLLAISVNCKNSKIAPFPSAKAIVYPQQSKDSVNFSRNNHGITTIHVFVALCDNKYQGIVPVPSMIGNGQDAVHNLYWGAANGVKSFFSKSAEWKLVKITLQPSDNIIERLLFKNKNENVYLLADAYNGKYIRQATIDFLSSLSGNLNTGIVAGSDTIYFGGSADLCAYIGHDGLMDFTLSQQFISEGNKKHTAIILACYSKSYFSGFIKSTEASPLLWTNGLMAPEAYTLHDALHAWIKNEKAEEIRAAAAKAYSKYQHCSNKAAMNLLTTGW
ncbi:MAG: hypothetical protein QM764_17215 [Chitinophagaceae bacterium]